MWKSGAGEARACCSAEVNPVNTELWRESESNKTTKPTGCTAGRNGAPGRRRRRVGTWCGPRRRGASGGTPWRRRAPARSPRPGTSPPLLRPPRPWHASPPAPSRRASPAPRRGSPRPARRSRPSPRGAAARRATRQASGPSTPWRIRPGQFAIWGSKRGGGVMNSVDCGEEEMEEENLE
jgi:hypothetical protein